MRTLMPVGALVAAALSMSAGAASVQLEASADNTLYSGALDLSNGAGDHFFAGRNGGGGTRRGLITFDVAGAIPAGSTITDVTLRLYMSRTSSGPQSVSLHRLTNSWGEGTSDAPKEEGGGGAAMDGDATWPYRFYNEAVPGDSIPWDTEGGDFDPVARATTTVGIIDFYSWSSAAMVDDVQAWLDDPATCYGWLVHGNEASSFTTKRFDTRENPTAVNRPRLTVSFEPPPCPADLDGSGDVGFGDILAVIGAWGPCGGCPEDLDGSGDVGFGDILAVIGAWGPC